MTREQEAEKYSEEQFALAERGQMTEYEKARSDSAIKAYPMIDEAAQIKMKSIDIPRFNESQENKQLAFKAGSDFGYSLAKEEGAVEIKAIKEDRRIWSQSDKQCRDYAKGLENKAAGLVEALESIAAEKCKPSFDEQLPKLERGNLISIIDTDTAIARAALRAWKERK